MLTVLSGANSAAPQINVDATDGGTTNIQIGKDGPFAQHATRPHTRGNDKIKMSRSKQLISH